MGIAPNKEVMAKSNDSSLEEDAYPVPNANNVTEKPIKNDGTIAVDALYSPIVKVKYNVTNARVGQDTDYDKLTLEIWTDGSVHPVDALAYSAKILKEQVQVFINFYEKFYLTSRKQWSV